MTSVANSPIVLYDIPSKGRCSCWSPNVWKTRLVLNYKEIPYTTEWTEYPEIEPKLKGLGIPPNPPGEWSAFSCPAARLSDGEYVMDSLKINEKLEELYPQPSIHLDWNVQQKIRPSFGGAVNALMPIVIPAVWRNILREPSATFFAEDRQQRFGKTLEQLERDEGGEAMWEVARNKLESFKLEIQQLKRGDGPYVLGSTVCYADFLIAAILTWLEKADPAIYERFVEYDENLKKIHEACRPWLHRDDH